jgi:hypothetical protein
MYQTAKKAREAMKNKAKRLASDRPLQKVDSSTFTPPEMLKADVKTGLRPVSRRAYKSGGKVDGSCGPMRADRKQRKSGGKTEAVAYANAKVNRNVKDANEDRDGEKHVGGLKRGGAAYARGGMPIKGHSYHTKSDEALRYIIKDAGEAARAMRGHSPKSEAKYLDQVNDASTVLNYRKQGGKQIQKDNSDKDDSFKRGGRAKKYDGGPLGGANRMMAAASQRAGVPNAMLGFSGVKRGALSPMRATGLKKGGKANRGKKEDGGSATAIKDSVYPMYPIQGDYGDKAAKRHSESINEDSNLLSNYYKNKSKLSNEMLDKYYSSKRLNDLKHGVPENFSASGSTGLKRGGKADDKAQDKALVKKAMRQHETAQHGGKHSELKLRRGGYAKKQAGGGMTDAPPPPPPPPADYQLTPAQRRMIRQGQDPFAEGIMPGGGRPAPVPPPPPPPPPPAPRRAAGGKITDIERVLSRATAQNPNPKKRYVSYAGEERPPARMARQMDPLDEQMADAEREAKMEQMYKAFRAKKAAAARQQKKEEDERAEDYRRNPPIPVGFKRGGDAKRMARASGGRTKKGKTNINIVIDAGGAKAPMGLGALPPLPMPGGRPVPPPMPVGGPGAAPMGMPAGPMPPAAPPPAMPGAGPMPMGRKHGGRTMSYKDMTAGAGSGEGRLQKTEIAMHKRPARRAGGKVYRSYKDMDAGAGSGLGRLEKTEIASRK